MRTTIAVDDHVLDELMRAEPNVSRSEAIRRAIQAYLERRRQEGFMRLAGSRLVDLDWRTAERQELDETRQTSAAPRRHGRRR